MAHTGRAIPSQLRHPSIAGSHAASGHSPALLARVNEKKVELENLRQLRDLSAGLASQMEALEEKLATLTDGTEGLWNDSSKLVNVADLFFLPAVAAVLSNWHNVLRAIHMASRESWFILEYMKYNAEPQQRKFQNRKLVRTSQSPACKVCLYRRL